MDQVWLADDPWLIIRVDCGTGVAQVPHFSKYHGFSTFPMTVNLSTPWYSDDPWFLVDFRYFHGGHTSTFEMSVSNQEAKKLVEALGGWRDASRNLGQR